MAAILYLSLPVTSDSIDGIDNTFIELSEFVDTEATIGIPLRFGQQAETHKPSLKSIASRLCRPWVEPEKCMWDWDIHQFVCSYLKALILLSKPKPIIFELNLRSIRRPLKGTPFFTHFRSSAICTEWMSLLEIEALFTTVQPEPHYRYCNFDPNPIDSLLSTLIFQQEDDYHIRFTIFYCSFNTKTFLVEWLMLDGIITRVGQSVPVSHG